VGGGGGGGGGGRAGPNIWSIYQKMIVRCDLSNSHDLVRGEHPLPDENPRLLCCWWAWVHSLWQPIGPVKDYIAQPPVRRSQSCTPSVGPEGKPLEVPIRHQENARHAELASRALAL